MKPSLPCFEGNALPLGHEAGIPSALTFASKFNTFPASAKLPHIQQNLSKKKDSIFSFEKVTCSGVARRGASGGIHPGRRFSGCINAVCSKI